MSTIAKRFATVSARIAAAARRAGRHPDEITLVAVTKTWPVEVVAEAYAAGVRHFGENRPEEQAAKRQALLAQLGPDSGAIWHHIGDVQSRKTAIVAESSDFLHALDRMKIARRLDNRCRDLGKRLPVLLEVNVSGEASKSGFNAADWEDDDRQRAALVAAAGAIRDLAGLEIRGLMTMAPWEAPAEQVRDIFRRTRLLSLLLAEAVPGARWDALSMGMSDDFEIAIEEGATHVRVGRALFGERSP